MSSPVALPELALDADEWLFPDEPAEASDEDIWHAALDEVFDAAEAEGVWIEADLAETAAERLIATAEYDAHGIGGGVTFRRSGADALRLVRADARSRLRPIRRLATVRRVRPAARRRRSTRARSSPARRADESELAHPRLGWEVAAC